MNPVAATAHSVTVATPKMAQVRASTSRNGAHSSVTTTPTEWLGSPLMKRWASAPNEAASAPASASQRVRVSGDTNSATARIAMVTEAPRQLSRNCSAGSQGGTRR